MSKEQEAHECYGSCQACVTKSINDCGELCKTWIEQERGVRDSLIGMLAFTIDAIFEFSPTKKDAQEALILGMAFSKDIEEARTDSVDSDCNSEE